MLKIKKDESDYSVSKLFSFTDETQNAGINLPAFCTHYKDKASASYFSRKKIVIGTPAKSKFSRILFSR